MRYTFCTKQVIINHALSIRRDTPKWAHGPGPNGSMVLARPKCAQHWLVGLGELINLENPMFGGWIVELTQQYLSELKDN